MRFVIEISSEISLNFVEPIIANEEESLNKSSSTHVGDERRALFQ